MRHIFRAQKIGWAEEKDGVWFDAKKYTRKQAEAQFKPYKGRTKDGYPYKGYEYGGQKYYKVDYMGKYPNNKMPRNDYEL